VASVLKSVISFSVPQSTVEYVISQVTRRRALLNGN